MAGQAYKHQEDGLLTLTDLQDYRPLENWISVLQSPTHLTTQTKKRKSKAWLRKNTHFCTDHNFSNRGRHPKTFKIISRPHPHFSMDDSILNCTPQQIKHLQLIKNLPFSKALKAYLKLSYFPTARTTAKIIPILKQRKSATAVESYQSVS